jgi:hypothetical protein
MQKAKVEIDEIVHSFVEQVVALVQRQTVQRVQSAVASAFAGSTVSPKVGASARPAPAAPLASRKGRKLNLSPKAIAVRKLQGKYLGIMRALPAVGRERVSKIAREQGVDAAIRFAATLQ